jgi:hypothetical protein
VSATGVTASGRVHERVRASAAFSVFAVMWAFVAVFHIVGYSAYATGFVDHPSGIGASQVAVGVAALLVLLQPSRSWRLALLAALELVSVWMEAPAIGNHWVLVGLVDLGLLGALAIGGRDRERVAQSFLPVARWCLLGFYVFAAFAKYNSAFFNTTVSCGTLYFDQVAKTIGVHTPLAVGASGWAALVPLGTALTEAAVPLLLFFRRTRLAGVVVGLAFHSVIALNQVHLFADFSAVVVALLILFLPGAFFEAVSATWLSMARRTRRVLQLGTVVAVAVVLAAQWVDHGVLDHAFVDGRTALWFVVDGVVIVGIARFIVKGDRTADRGALSLAGVPWCLWLVPALVIVNGLTPYFEIKTAYSFTMYSNLVTADGDTNHFLVPGTLPLTNVSDPVRIQYSSDLALRQYVDERYELPYFSLRVYLSEHPNVSVRFVRNGVEHDLAKASDDPDLVKPVSAIERKLFALRAVDQRSPARCQESFLPAL